MRDGKKAKERINKYGLANSIAGAPSDRTALNAPSGLKNIIGVPINAIKNPTNSA